MAGGPPVDPTPAPANTMNLYGSFDEMVSWRVDGNLTTYPLICDWLIVIETRLSETTVIINPSMIGHRGWRESQKRFSSKWRRLKNKIALIAMYVPAPCILLSNQKSYNGLDTYHPWSEIG